MRQYSLENKFRVIIDTSFYVSAIIVMMMGFVYKMIKVCPSSFLLHILSTFFFTCFIISIAIVLINIIDIIFMIYVASIMTVRLMTRPFWMLKN